MALLQRFVDDRLVAVEVPVEQWSDLVVLVGDIAIERGHGAHHHGAHCFSLRSRTRSSGALLQQTAGDADSHRSRVDACTPTAATSAAGAASVWRRFNARARCVVPRLSPSPGEAPPPSTGHDRRPVEGERAWSGPW